MTPEEFHRILCELCEEFGASNLVATVPGVYEAVSEHFNNEVLDKWSELQEAQRSKYVCELCDTEYDTQEELDDCMDSHVDEIREEIARGLGRSVT
jgi:hypothetical protein